MQLEGNLVKWQKWHIRLGFNYREGVVLHNVGYRTAPVSSLQDAWPARCVQSRTGAAAHLLHPAAQLLEQPACLPHPRFWVPR